MNCNYFFRILKPSQNISVIIDQYQLNENIMLSRRHKTELTSSELTKSYLKHPLIP